MQAKHKVKWSKRPLLQFCWVTTAVSKNGRIDGGNTVGNTRWQMAFRRHHSLMSAMPVLDLSKSRIHLWAQCAWMFEFKDFYHPWCSEVCMWKQNCKNSSWGSTRMEGIWGSNIIISKTMGHDRNNPSVTLTSKTTGKPGCSGILGLFFRFWVYFHDLLLNFKVFVFKNLF